MHYSIDMVINQKMHYSIDMVINQEKLVFTEITTISNNDEKKNNQKGEMATKKSKANKHATTCLLYTSPSPRD